MNLTVAALLRAGVVATVYDPVAQDQARQALAQDLVAAQPELLARLHFAQSPMQAVAQAHGLLILTEWKAYRNPDWQALKAAMHTPLVLDGRNLFEPTEPRAHGIDCVGIGR